MDARTEAKINADQAYRDAVNKIWAPKQEEHTVKEMQDTIELSKSISSLTSLDFMRLGHAHYNIAVTMNANSDKQRLLQTAIENYQKVDKKHPEYRANIVETYEEMMEYYCSQYYYHHADAKKLLTILEDLIDSKWDAENNRLIASFLRSIKSLTMQYNQNEVIALEATYNTYFSKLTTVSDDDHYAHAFYNYEAGNAAWPDNKLNKYLNAILCLEKIKQPKDNHHRLFALTYIKLIEIPSDQEKKVEYVNAALSHFHKMETKDKVTSLVAELVVRLNKLTDYSKPALREFSEAIEVPTICKAIQDNYSEQFSVLKERLARMQKEEQYMQMKQELDTAKTSLKSAKRKLYTMGMADGFFKEKADKMAKKVAPESQSVVMGPK